MKQIFSLVILCTLFLTGCSSDDSSNDSDGDTYIRFTVNGQNYDYNPETIVSLITSINGNEGVDDTYKYISLTLPNNYTEGTYSFVLPDPNDVESYNAYYESEGENIYVDASSGSITITSVEAEYVSGTFSFSGDNGGSTISITNGSFRAPK